MDPFPLAGLLRRIRRTADWSQRELAEQVGAPRSTVAAAERGVRDLPVSLLARVAQAAGGRLVVLDSDGGEVVPMDDDAVRDRADRRFPAHLDTRHGDEDWWGGPHRPRLRPPRYTVDRDRHRRDRRRSAGIPDEHHSPQPGDGLADRAAARRREANRRAAQERERRFLDGTLGQAPEWLHCTCPPDCEYAEERNEDLSHASICPCRCDVS